MSRSYTEAEARILGRRMVCYSEGHKLESEMDRGLSGGVLAGTDRSFGRPAACDEIKCKWCDVTFTATYPPIGQEAK